MKPTEIVFAPSVWVTFTKEDVRTLSEMARAHYDPTCRSFADPGGLLYGLANKLGKDDAADWKLNLREVDLLAKISENCHHGFGDPSFYLRFLKLFQLMQNLQETNAKAVTL